jgi:peptidoglycan hydrolase-like protein with peptidoglycan-binding domain
MTTVLDYFIGDQPSPPDVHAAVAAGTRVVILKRSQCYYDRSHAAWVFGVDPVYARDADAWRAAGCVVGAYLFPAFGIGAPSPREQVQAFAQSAGRILPGVDLPPALDVEFPGAGIADTHRTAREVGDLVLEFVAQLHAEYGCKPLVYSSHVQMCDDNGLDGVLGGSEELGECHLWDKTPYPVEAGHAPVPGAWREPHVGPAAWDPHDYWRIPPPWSTWWLVQQQGDVRGFPGVHQCDLGTWHMLSADKPMDSRWRWVQQKLGVAVTGVWDAATDQALRLFQQSKGLDADGVVGPRTFCQLAWS